MEARVAVNQFTDHLNGLLERRGKRRLAARDEIVQRFSNRLCAEQAKRDRLKYEAVKQMWESELCKRMDRMDEQIQIAHDRLVVVKNFARLHSTAEEYTDLLRRVEEVVATYDPYDMGPDIKEALDEMELANVPPVPEIAGCKPEE
ncbi:MAG: hypothetical protein CMH98_00025 [Oceanospirillaceae bacterium]|nr:hypothetical protein [Oceanospirillaceae bacterium]